MKSYNIHTDEHIPRYRHKTWECERAIYDIRVDAYWLVTKNPEGYRFAGPIVLSKHLIAMLPPLNELERRDVLKHLPVIPHAPYGVQMDTLEEEENDGA